ncbi:cyclophilin-like fold protein [Priestia abyssalis]|uniref:cyclophilin-like fold protein n=1 Tax=Priestia abyssalis TaxID=1221450 RepID=UPI000995335B|nr:cyclophilin-like fold protein [Priestia abyssalis]
MKKTVQRILLSLTVSSMFLTACNSRTNEENTSNEENLTIHQSSKQGVTADESNNRDSQDSTLDHEGSDAMGGIRIKLTFNNEEVIVNMYDNPTSKDVLSLLPLTLTFEDYAGTEKISYPSNKLSTEEAPSGSDPSIGDLTYYAPWGNLAIFYKDFRYSNGLIKLGKIESGIEKLENVNGDFTVTIEKVD